MAHPDGLPAAALQPVVVDWKCNLTYSIVVWVSNGTARVHFEDTVQLLQAGQALWIPRYIAHKVEHDAHSLALSIMVRTASNHKLGDGWRLINVPPAQAQWMFHLMLLTLSPLHQGQASAQRVLDTLAHFAATSPSTPRPVPLAMPRHSAARKVVSHLLAHPHGTLHLADYARKFAVSERTLRRAFLAETGLNFRQWRQQARLGALDRVLPHSASQPPAMTTRWVNLANQDLVLWAVRGRASIYQLAHGEGTGRERTQQLQAGQFMLIPAGQSLRLQIEQGSLLLPLSLPAGSLPSGQQHRMPCQLPVEFFQAMLHRAVSHITLLRPVHFDPLDTVKLLQLVPHYPGLPWPRSARMRSLAGTLAADTRGMLPASAAAEQHGLSLRQLQRRWSAETGMSLRAWRQACRFQHAEALLNAGFSVFMVSLQLGFSDAGNFSRAYAKSRGRRPKPADYTLPTDIF